MSDPCYELILDKDVNQNEAIRSFIGGLPLLPPEVDLPHCRLCGSKLTFFFHVTFPEKHSWAGLSLVVFACTSCASKDYCIPEMLIGELLGATIPDRFLDDYQRNFRFITYSSSRGVIRRDYAPRVAFCKWVLKESGDPFLLANKIGGGPTWLLDDESPDNYHENTKMVFLMQLLLDFQFDLLPGAPPEMELAWGGGMEPSRHRYYKLFLANQIYFFGTMRPVEPVVYVITQVE